LTCTARGNGERMSDDGKFVCIRDIKNDKTFESHMPVFSVHVFTHTIFCNFVNSSASNRIIPAKDHASIQINLAEIDSATGRITGNHKILTISGAIRRMVSMNNIFNICFYVNILNWYKKCMYLLAHLWIKICFVVLTN